MGKVLVVDDDPGITLLLQRIIAKRGHQILIARNGWEGLSRAQAEIPDLIFTDVRMPDLGGVELAAFLKADPSLAHIPVVILSGTAFLLDLESTDADDILTKPFDLKAVYAILDRYLNENSSPQDGASKDSQKAEPPTPQSPFSSLANPAPDFPSDQP